MKRGLIGALLLLVGNAAFAQGESGSNAAVSVRVSPAGPLLTGTVVTIDGMSPLDAKAPVALRVQTPDGKSLALAANANSSGDYSLNFTSTEAPGRYRVEARSPGGTASGRAEFEVVIYDEVEVLEDSVSKAKKEAQALGQAIDSIAADIDAQIGKLPDNPAKDELKGRWQELQPQLKKAVHDFGEIDAVLAPIRRFAGSDPILKPLLRLPAQQLDDWTKRSAAERQRITQQLAASRRANVTCESLERVVEGFRFAAALVGMITEPFSLVTEPLKEMAKNVGGQVADGVLKRLGLKPEKQGALSAHLSKLKGKFEAAVGESNLAAAKSIKSADTLIGKLGEVAAWLAGKAFDRYCERFSGPFDGQMHAEFFAQSSGEKWWEYDIRFKGQLDLRYAKGSVAGAATAVNGEFTGQAVNFTLKEDAIRIGWPKLMASARLFKRSIIPKPWIFGAPLPNEDRPVEIEGKAAAAMVKPYGFMVPVQGELVDNQLSLRFLPATQDYTANARVVYVIVSPLSLVPAATAFELPYKDAGFFFLRVSGGEAVKLKVQRNGKSLSVKETVKRDQGVAVAKGQYQLKLELCNPAGAC